MEDNRSLAKVDKNCQNFTEQIPQTAQTMGFKNRVLYQEYEDDKRKRLGEEGAKPKRIRYKPITR